MSINLSEKFGVDVIEIVLAATVKRVNRKKRSEIAKELRTETMDLAKRILTGAVKDAELYG